MSNGQIYVRTDNALYRFEKKKLILLLRQTMRGV